MTQFDAARYQNHPVAQQYGALRGQPISKTQLQDLAKQAVENGSLDEAETAVFQDIVSSGKYDKADLADLPPQIQALFNQSAEQAQAGQAPAKVADEKLSLNDDPTLSPARKSAMAALDKVVYTSTQGVPVTKADRDLGRRNLFDHTEWAPEAVKKNGVPDHTSCGLLPSHTLRQIGVTSALIAANGTEGVRSEAQRLGIWVKPDGSNSPKPGDIYALHYPEPTKPKDLPKDGISHVGVVNKVEGEVWNTADAGQGTREQQKAKLVSRTMTRTNGIPTSPGRTDAGELNRPREVAGWVDLDRLMFLQTYQDMLCGRTKQDDVVDKFSGVKRQPGFDRDKGLGKDELKALASLAMADGKLDETEKKVFREIAKQLGGKLEASDLQALPGFAYSNNTQGHGTVTLDNAEHTRLLAQSTITQADWDALPAEIRQLSGG